MKILIIGSQKPFYAESFYNKAFNQLGFGTVMLDISERVEHPLFTRIIHIRTSLLHFLQNSIYINKALDQKVRKIDLDAIIVFRGEFISTQSLKMLSENYKLYLLYPDMFKFQHNLRNRLPLFLTIFTTANNTDFYRKLRGKHVVMVPWAYDSEFHRV
ncbi:MAG: hypothetical protein QXU18_01265 [Thermoplasmatales archaeon]